MGNRFIDKLKSYGVLDPTDASALEAATAQSQAYGAKTDLIREGDRPGPVFVILEGWACRYKVLPSGTRQVTAFLMPGDCCDLHVGLLAEMDHTIQTITLAKIARSAGKTWTRLWTLIPKWLVRCISPSSSTKASCGPGSPAWAGAPASNAPLI